MDAQIVIDTSLSVNASTLGNAEASQLFRESLKNTIKVEINMSQEDRRYLKKVVGAPLLFTCTKMVIHDHVIIAALRDITRKIYESEFHVSRTSERTLVVGSSMREIRMYNSNPNVHYHIHGKEDKDYDRIIRPALLDIGKMLKSKAKKSNYRVFMPPEVDTTQPRGIIKRYSDHMQVMADYMHLKKMPANIHTGYAPANTLLFEDSIYNLGELGICKWFSETGANVAYGYGLFPLDLINPDMPENRMYKFTREGEWAYLTWPFGYSNGYAHIHKDWAAILKKPYLEGYNLRLAVEITARVGPMVVFKIMRAQGQRNLVRNLALTQAELYVKLLDVERSFDKRTGDVNPKLMYFSVKEDEYLDTINYMLSLDIKSVTFANCMSFVRRRMGGMSLVSKELLAPWDLPKKFVYKFATAVTIQAMILHERASDLQAKVDEISASSRIKTFFKKVTSILVLPLKVIYDLIMERDMVDKVVLYVCGETFQRIHCKPEIQNFSAILSSDQPNEEDLPDCPICRFLHHDLGEQKLICEHKEVEHDFALDDKEIANLRAKLADTDHDPVGLARVKDLAKEKMPKSGFSHKAKVHYIMGGPGTGKSYIIRKMADQSDLVLAPFNKLKPDYEGVISSDGSTQDLMFKTTHRAMAMSGYKRIFVDEFTSFPYEYLACIVKNNAAEEIFLVGDTNQTKVQEPDEGIYTGNRIPLETLGKHTLRVNFRNPKDIVAFLNKTYGYEMEAYSSVETSVNFVSAEELPQLTTCTSMAFSTHSAKVNTGSEKNTVRANQGGTTKNAVLYTTSMDASLFGIPSLTIVAMSRHTDQIYLVSDKGQEAEAYRASLGFTPDFYEHMQTWLTFTGETYTATKQEDHAVAVVLKQPQVARDAFRTDFICLPNMAAGTAHDPMNEVASQIIGDNFSNGVVNEDLLTPVNSRGHPKDMSVRYFSFGTGVGNAYSAKRPMQTLQVMNARYLTKIPTFNFGTSQEGFAQKLVDLYFAEHMSLNFSVFNEAEIATVIAEFLRSAGSKHYHTSYQGLDNPDGRVVRFHLKDIFKPKSGLIDVTKPGQGISAWNVDLQSMYCSIFRILTRHMRTCERPHVLSDVYMDELSFIDSVQEQFVTLPATAMNGITDGEMFDAQQSKFTQYVERYFWYRLGVEPTLLDHYYSFRQNALIRSDIGQGRMGFQKTSGEPGTLVNNGIVAKVLSNAIIRGEGPVGLIYKGDDFNKRQVGLKVDQDMKARIDAVCPLRLRVNISANSEFCGLVCTGNQIYPSIYRKLNKIVGHRFRTYDHFCEYQVGLRDYIEKINQLGLEGVIAGNALTHLMTYEHANNVWETIVSYAHIDKQQFLEKAIWHDIPDAIPVNSDGEVKVKY